MCLFYTLFPILAPSNEIKLSNSNLPAVDLKDIAAPSEKKKVTIPSSNGHDHNSDSYVHTNGTENGKVAKKVKAASAVKPKKVARPKAKIKAVPAKKQVKTTITFQLRFHTTFGQNLFITGNHDLLGNGDIETALPLEYLNNELWTGSIELDASIKENIIYNYVLRNADGTVSFDWGSDKILEPSKLKGEVLIIDGWNYAGYYENTFYTEPFQHVLLKDNHTTVKPSSTKKYTHTFRVKSPLLSKGQTLCLLGNTKSLHSWNKEKPLLMSCDDGGVYFGVDVDLDKDTFPIVYKYGVYDTVAKSFVRFEDGDNRSIYDNVVKGKHTIVNDAFAVLPSTTWKGAGIAIPVFSLKSNDSFGVGEFTDLKLLVDWSKQVGLKIIQILPINDTTATHTWTDSYPYAAISAFALHPIFLNLSKVVDAKNKKYLQALEEKREKLNALDALDYESVINIKLDFVKKIYASQSEKVFKSKDYQSFFSQNKHWLVPYSVFCYLRDEYGTSHFNEWPAFRSYKEEEIATFAEEGSAAYNDIALNYFIQYHLHLQLKEVTEYAHENGIILKGDIPIGVYRYGADAWQQPELYHLDVQAGAPPDSFAIKGQNWSFPTYNWQRMRQDGFAWWKQRFEQMSCYFDAFRIDHILGFFRIWSIPMHSVEGIMGRFVPAIAVHINEFQQRGISFDHHRLTKPFINDAVLWDLFGDENEHVKTEFLEKDGYGNYNLKPSFDTQRKVEIHFATFSEDEKNDKLKQGLYDLISNIILFDEGDNQHFHFRFAMDGTTSFKHLDGNMQARLQELYINYFFRRQDNAWMKEAMQKLPALKRVTNMLVCGEDLGLVPDCVPDVMKQLGILSLEIQRMPKDSTKQFFHPNDAPYLSVVTPSTHDMSTIRGWWQEDRAKTQYFFNYELGQWGEAPYYCEPWVNRVIVLQHLYSPAMWSIFQLQDLLGSDGSLRRENPDDERINIPADPKHYWRYRMNIPLEQLTEADDFNNDLIQSLRQSGR